MKFGVCCGVDHAGLLQELGFDYYELGFGGIGSMTEEEYQNLKAKAAKLTIKPEAMNGMLPGTFRLTGEEADLAPVKPFLERAFARAAALGNQVVVFGSGGARCVPDGFTDLARVYDQLEAYLLLASDCAKPYGINIAIEPLCFKECNIINLVSEGAYLAGRTNRDNVRVLADYYHVGMNKENTESIVGFAHRMEHCHIANPNGRRLPMPNDGHDYTPFFAALNRAKYEKRVSIEGGLTWDDPTVLRDELTQSLALMKDYAKRCK